MVKAQKNEGLKKKNPEFGSYSFCIEDQFSTINSINSGEIHKNNSMRNWTLNFAYFRNESNVDQVISSE